MYYQETVRPRRIRQVQVPAKALSLPPSLVERLLCGSTAGVAVIDRQFRYRAINETLAAMNGPSRHAHLGKTLHEILGPLAEEVGMHYESTFSAARPTLGHLLVGTLPGQHRERRWVVDYYPVQNDQGGILEVCALVAEVNDQYKLQQSLRRLTRQLLETGSDQQTSLRALRNALLDRTNRDWSPAPPRPPLSANAESASLQEGTPHLPTSPAESRRWGGGSLSQREREITRLLVQGHSNKEVAWILKISPKTVETHRAHIMAKLRLRSIVSLVHYAIRKGIVPLV